MARVLSAEVMMRLAREGVEVKQPEVETVSSLKCPDCAFVAKTKSGLLLHLKKHKGE